MKKKKGPVKLEPISQDKTKARHKITAALIAAAALTLFLSVVRPGPAVAASAAPLFLIDSKTAVLSDSIKVSFFFNHQPEIRQVKSDNRLEFIIDFPRCDFPVKKYRENIKDELLDGVLISKTDGGTRVLIRQLQMTHPRLLQGYDKSRKHFYVSVLFYRPFESYSKYEARLAEIAAYKKRGVPIVVIDAGHGGKDPGAKSVYGDVEKSLNLKFARMIADNINETGLCRAYLTRSGDRFLSLGRRVFIANQYGADAFISVHFNANKSKKVRGFETYYLSNGTASDKASEILADIENSAEFVDENIASEQDYQVQSILLDLKEKENIKESGILSTIITGWVSRIGSYPVSEPKQANFAVLRNLNMPSILIEVGYLSNAEDISFLRSGANAEEICARTALGIINYLCPKIPLDYGSVKKNGRSPGTAPDKTGVKAAIRPTDPVAAAIKTATRKPAAGAAKKTAEYTVKKGDTLSGIAKKHKIALRRLLELNHKSGAADAIFPGEVLIISDGQ